MGLMALGINNENKARKVTALFQIGRRVPMDGCVFQKFSHFQRYRDLPNNYVKEKKQPADRLQMVALMPLNFGLTSLYCKIQKLY